MATDGRLPRPSSDAAKALSRHGRSRLRHYGRNLLYRPPLRGVIHRTFFTDLALHTHNFGNVTWHGQPIWRNVLDLWALQKAIAKIRRPSCWRPAPAVAARRCSAPICST